MSEFPPPGFAPIPSTVPGVEVYAPTRHLEQRPDVVDFKCPKCGATIGYQVEEGRLVCEYCGYREAPEAQHQGTLAERFEFDLSILQRSQQGWGTERKDLACQRCGAVVSLPPDTLTYACPFCGSNKVLYREPLEDMLRPRFLIPFKVSPSECREVVRHWLGKHWLLPESLRSASPDQFNPIYIPYWTFDAVCHATWEARVARGTNANISVFIDMEDHEYTQATWRDESGKVKKEFNGLLVPGTTRLNMKALGQVDRYGLADLILYEPGYLAGMQAQAYDLPLETAWDLGRRILRDRAQQACLDRIGSSAVENFRMQLDFRDEQWRYILVPIYTSLYRHGNKTFQILINGQNGKIAGPRPVDWFKLWLTVAALLTPGILTELASLFFPNSQTGSFLAGAGIFFMATGGIIAYFLVSQAMEMEHV